MTPNSPHHSASLPQNAMLTIFLGACLALMARGLSPEQAVEMIVSGILRLRER